MRIAIIGAGAMGSIYAYYLSNGNDVTLIDASAQRVSFLRENGICLLENDGRSLQHPCNVFSSSGNLGVMDLVLVFVKALYTATALKENYQLIGRETIVLSLQNGYGAWDVINSIVKCRVLVGTSMHGATMRPDGVVAHTAVGVTTIGSPDNSCTAVNTLVQIFSRCGLPTKASDNILQNIWQKLIINAGINGITAILRIRNRHMAACNYALDLSDNIVSEAVAAANAAGCTFDTAQMRQIVHDTARITGDNLSSMTQDIQARRQTEADFIYAPILRVSAAHNLSCPFTQAIYDLLQSTHAAILSGELL